MARALMTALFASAAALVAPLAEALGPLQPFTPPLAAARSSDAAPAAPTPIAETSGLAGVRLGSSPRALIDGEWVALGQPVRDGKLVAVNAHEVVLRLANGRTEHLSLFPAAAAAPNPEASLVKRNLP